MARRRAAKDSWHRAVFLLGVGGAIAVLGVLLYQRRQAGELGGAGSLLDQIGFGGLGAGAGGGGGGGGGYVAPAVPAGEDAIIPHMPNEPGDFVTYEPAPAPTGPFPVSPRDPSTPSGTRRRVAVRTP